jgi:hypothetical protein
MLIIREKEDLAKYISLFVPGIGRYYIWLGARC